MGEEYHIARKSVKVPVAELEWSLASGRESLSGLPHHRKPARNGFAEVERIIHHLPWEYHPARWIEPDPARHQEYQFYVDKYIATYPQMRDLTHDMVQHVAGSQG